MRSILAVRPRTGLRARRAGRRGSRARNSACALRAATSECAPRRTPTPPPDGSGGASDERLEARRLALEDVLHAEADDLLETRMGEHVKAVVSDRFEDHFCDL